MAKLGRRLAAGLADAAREAGVPLQVNGFGSLLTPFFTTQPVRDYQSALTADTAAYGRFFRAMLETRRLSAAVAVRSVVPVGSAHRAGCGPDDQAAREGDEGGRGRVASWRVRRRPERGPRLRVGVPLSGCPEA